MILFYEETYPDGKIVRYFNCSQAILGSHKAQDVAEQLRNNNLDNISISHSSITAESATILANAMAQSQSLVSLSLYEVEFDNIEAMRNLAKGISACQSLTKFSMCSVKFTSAQRRTYISDAGIKVFFESIAASNLQHFDCEYNDMTPKSATELATLVRDRFLNLVSLKLQLLFDDGCMASLFGALKDNRTLKVLEIQGDKGSKFGSTSLTALNTFLGAPTCSLEVLSMSCDFGDNDACLLATGLMTNNSLHELAIYKLSLYSSQSKMAEHHIGNKGAIALSKVLAKHPGLHRVKLENQLIGDPGAVALADAIKQNPRFSYVNLSQNQIGQQGAKALYGVLPKTKQILGCGATSTDQNALVLDSNLSEGATMESLAEALNSAPHVTNFRSVDPLLSESEIVGFLKALGKNDSLLSIEINWATISSKVCLAAFAKLLETNDTVERLRFWAAELHAGTDDQQKYGAGYEQEARELTDQIILKLKWNTVNNRLKSALKTSAGFESGTSGIVRDYCVSFENLKSKQSDELFKVTPFEYPTVKRRVLAE